MERRTALATIGGGLCSILSGCSAVDTVVSGCREGKERLNYDGPIHGNTWSGFKLSVRPKEVELGEEITFKLINIITEPQDTGTSPQYLIQRRTEHTWKSIYWWSREGYLLIKRWHDRGEGFAWTFRATQFGFEPDDRDDYAPDYTVCMDITPGSYRFVYFGFDNAAMAVKFEIRSS